MAYLVRKLLKRESLDLIKNTTDIKDVIADFATTEFRTKNGKLSTWCIEKVQDIDDAVLAIAVTSSKIERMDFIIIDTSYIEQQNLKFKQSYAGIDIAVSELQDTHYDIEELTLPKLISCTSVYKRVLEADDDSETYIIRYLESKIKDLLEKAISDGRLDEGKLNKNIKKFLNNK